MENIIQAINQFRDERDWRQYHNEKDLALSVSLEAAELLELFQWEQPEDVVLTKRERLAEELADVLIYSLMMADNLNFDVEEIINKKLVKNAQKYPIDQVLAKNKSDLEAKN
ncbi:MAG TPA: nucleotide pyrophosphohydrolase [Candidatus Enterococcus avicola]|uniref:Nucleotide pyrophosphohydrolase n=1 Tax=Candidatus Enterococcus avicola TaxID=2838561 RepID=A0A9D2F8K5_9ENTE|nr:nucleotide pyrophosphohydrolase [Candidatus Enterococcus avicola]